MKNTTTTRNKKLEYSLQLNGLKVQKESSLKGIYIVIGNLDIIPTNIFNQLVRLNYIFQFKK